MLVFLICLLIKKNLKKLIPSLSNLFLFQMSFTSQPHFVYFKGNKNIKDGWRETEGTGAGLFIIISKVAVLSYYLVLMIE